MSGHGFLLASAPCIGTPQAGHEPIANVDTLETIQPAKHFSKPGARMCSMFIEQGPID